MDKIALLPLVEAGALIFGAALLSGCTTRPPAAFCDVSEPYFFGDAEEVVSTPDGPKRFIVGHNELGVGLCGWTPPT